MILNCKSEHFRQSCAIYRMDNESFYKKNQKNLSKELIDKTNLNPNKQKENEIPNKKHSSEPHAMPTIYNFK